MRTVHSPCARPAIACGLTPVDPHLMASRPASGFPPRIPQRSLMKNAARRGAGTDTVARVVVRGQRDRTCCGSSTKQSLRHGENPANTRNKLRFAAMASSDCAARPASGGGVPGRHRTEMLPPRSGRAGVPHDSRRGLGGSRGRAGRLPRDPVGGTQTGVTGRAPATTGRVRSMSLCARLRQATDPARSSTAMKAA